MLVHHKVLAVAEALYFSRGFEVSNLRYSAAERVRNNVAPKGN